VKLDTILVLTSYKNCMIDILKLLFIYANFKVSCNTCFLLVGVVIVFNQHKINFVYIGGDFTFYFKIEEYKL
jgi:hypothetical protein